MRTRGGRGEGKAECRAGAGNLGSQHRMSTSKEKSKWKDVRFMLRLWRNASQGIVIADIPGGGYH